MDNPVTTPKHRLAYLFLILITLAVYWQVRECEFINLDDLAYVSGNLHIRDGLTWKGVQWAFSGHWFLGISKADYWAPVAFLSHLCDLEIYGTRPAGHHFSSLLIHTANVVLLFAVLRRISASVWRSALVAALFALHPLNVESVAWIAERKGLLSAFFGILTIGAYARYCERPTLGRYLPVIAAFALGLMSKVTLVTLPLALWLLDYWPLGRWRVQSSVNSDQSTVISQRSVDRGRQLMDNGRWMMVLEKLPLLALSAVACVQAVAYMRNVGNLQGMEQLPLVHRFANALVSYVSYMGKMIWPQDLAIFYPHPGDALPMGEVAQAVAVLMCISILVAAWGRRFPNLVVGWLWYLGMLAPVIGIVQAGGQAMADRYAYLPLLGLFIILAWGGADLGDCIVRRFPKLTTLLKPASVLAFVVALAILAACTWRQVGHWRDSVTVFDRAVKVTRNNVLAHFYLATALAEEGRFNEAAFHYSEAVRVRLDPREVLERLERKLSGDMERLNQALKANPNQQWLHFNLANLLARQRRMDEAIQHYTEALRLDPSFTRAHNNLANALVMVGRLAEAVEHYQHVLESRPDHVETRYNLGVCLAKQGKTDEAVACMKRILEQRPDFEPARRALENFKKQ